MIQEIRFEEEWCNSCLQGEFSCFTDALLTRPAGHWLKIKINQATPVEKAYWNITCHLQDTNCGPAKQKWCNELYPVGSQQEVFVSKKEKERRQYIQVGRTIREKVTSGFEKYLESKKEEEPPACYKAFLKRQKKMEAEKKEAERKLKETKSK